MRRFTQFGTICEKHPWRSAAFNTAHNFTISKTPPWVFFTFFKIVQILPNCAKHHKYSINKSSFRKLLYFVKTCSYYMLINFSHQYFSHKNIFIIILSICGSEWLRVIKFIWKNEVIRPDSKDQILHSNIRFFTVTWSDL